MQAKDDTSFSIATLGAILTGCCSDNTLPLCTWTSGEPPPGQLDHGLGGRRLPFPRAPLTAGHSAPWASPVGLAAAEASAVSPAPLAMGTTRCGAFRLEGRLPPHNKSSSTSRDPAPSPGHALVLCLGGNDLHATPSQTRGMEQMERKHLESESPCPSLNWKVMPHFLHL